MSLIKSKSAILEAFRQPEVQFDPSNAKHVAAFKSLVLGEGTPRLLRQTPDVRFKLEHPFHDIRSMMLYRVGEAFVKGVN